MRFLHTADLHLCDPAFPEGAHKLSVLEELCALAREHDAFLISGDVFDSAAEARALETALRRLFTSLRPVPVLIIPGNHDFLRGPDPFDGRHDFGQSSNVRLLRSAPFEVFPAGKIVFYGFPFQPAKTSAELFREIAAKPSGETRVALIHGSAADRPELCGFAFAEENAEEGGQFVFSDADLSSSGFCYAACGHIHRRERWTCGNCLAAYPGSPDAVRITEEGPRRANSVSVGEDGKVSLEEIPLKTGLAALRTHLFVLPGDEDSVFEAADNFISSNPGFRHGAVIDGAGDPNRVRLALERVSAKWKGRLPVEPHFKLALQDSGEKTGGALSLAFLRKLSALSSGTDTPEKKELARRAAAVGWRALASKGISPEDLLSP